MTVAALREFPVSVEQAALMGELAPNGHVNNIWYFRYSENARVERYRQIGKSANRQVRSISERRDDRRRIQGMLLQGNDSRKTQANPRSFEQRQRSMTLQTGNLFLNIEAQTQGERFDDLLRHRNLVVERIVSSSAVEPTEYVQPQDEWVMLVQGEARLIVADEHVPLKSGDYVFLPAGIPHTVASVSQGAVWLAIHLHSGELEIREPSV